MCSHEIEIKNLNPDELVQHSILLIKGAVTGDACPKERDIRLRLRPADQPDAEGLPQQTRVSPKGDFKFLVNLLPYDSPLALELRFQYCSAETTLPIKYDLARGVYRVQSLLIICEGEEREGDELHLKQTCEIIGLNMRLVQSAYADRIRAAGFERRTFTLNPQCCLFFSSLTCADARQMGEKDLWAYFGKELLNSPVWGGQTHLKYVAFIGCTQYDSGAVAASGDFSYANMRAHLKAHAALGGGGLALFGSVYFYAWPCRFEEIVPFFENEDKVDVTKFPDDSNYRRTYGGVFASTLGAVCHETGHIFDLGHTNDGIMGAGLDYLNRVFTVVERTEDLPERVVENKPKASPESQGAKPKVTQLKQGENSFLKNYRQQRKNDSFFFTRNCALILAHHLWLNPRAFVGKGEVRFDAETKTFASPKDALKIVELRSKDNELVTFYEEFPAVEENVYNYKLAETEALCLERETHYAFVLTKSGNMKRFPDKAAE